MLYLLSDWYAERIEKERERALLQEKAKEAEFHQSVREILSRIKAKSNQRTNENRKN